MIISIPCPIIGLAADSVFVSLLRLGSLVMQGDALILNWLIVKRLILFGILSKPPSNKFETSNMLV
jgi:hypothetical protein